MTIDTPISPVEETGSAGDSRTGVTVEIRARSARDAISKLQRTAEHARETKRQSVEKEIDSGVWPQHTSRPRKEGLLVDYPSHLARVPFFKAGKTRETERLSTDPEVLTTPWGSIKRWGPGVNAYDDETLLALSHLCRTDEYKGPRKAVAKKLNLKIVESNQSADDEMKRIADSWLVEHARFEGGRTNAREICELLGDARGGFQRKSRRESVARLKNQNLTHLVVKGVKLARPSIFVPPFFVNDEGELKSDIEWDDRLFFYAGDPDVEGDFQLTFSESMTALLTSYTMLDASVYTQLTAYSKFIYKFVSSCMSSTKAYTIRFHKLALYIDYASKLKSLDKTAIGQDKIYYLATREGDVAEEELRKLRIDWREMRRDVEEASRAINKAQQRFELFLPPVERGAIPVLRAIT